MKDDAKSTDPWDENVKSSSTNINSNQNQNQIQIQNLNLLHPANKTRCKFSRLYETDLSLDEDNKVKFLFEKL